MLKVKIRDIEFKSPIIASSGTYGYGYEVDDFVDLSKIGCIITKSITKEPRKGNPSPRIHELRSGMINAIGLANVGVKEFCKNKLSKLNSIDTRFIISVAGTTIEEYIQVVNKIEKSGGLHVGYEVNVSCPNIKKGGMEFGLNKDATYELTSKLRSITDKLLIIKLSPNVTNITEIAESAELGGADAISAINTFIGLAIDHKTGKMLLSTTFGGVSGPAIKPLALAKIHSIYKKIKIPIIGIGGISSFEDIIQFLRVGSSMVQIGTLNYRDPSIISLFYNDLKVFLENKKIPNICDLVGDYIEH